jgi:hypothetical protein
MKIKLETPRLLLREVEEQDAAGFFALDSDPEVTRYLGMAPQERMEQSMETIRYIQKQYAELGIGRWALVLKECVVKTPSNWRIFPVFGSQRQILVKTSDLRHRSPKTRRIIAPETSKGEKGEAPEIQWGSVVR